MFSAVAVAHCPNATASASAATLLSHKTSAKIINQINLITSKTYQNSSITMSSSSSSLPSPSKSNNPPFLPPTRYSAAAAPHSLDPPSDPISAKRNLKSRLASGVTLYGLFLLSSSPTLAEIAGLAGYDYVVVDMEHGHGGISDALPCLHALAATGTAAILRLPESSSTWAKKALDLGPQGIMFPMIETAQSAAEAVSYCRFPPKGIRGSAHTAVRASGYGIDEGYLENYEDGILVMVQAETGKSIAEIESIAAVDGVDSVQMGPLDLSASLGYLWEPSHRKVREVLAEGERRMLEGGGKGKAYLSGFAMPHDPPEELKKRGYNMVAGAVDLGMFRQAAAEDVLKFRRAPGVDGEGGKREGDEDKAYWSE